MKTSKNFRKRRQDSDSDTELASAREKSGSRKDYKGAREGLKIDAENRKKLIPDLKKAARQRYARERWTKKKKEYEEDILDAEYLNDGINITEIERDDLQHKKDVLKIASEIENVHKHVDNDRYQNL